MNNFLFIAGNVLLKLIWVGATVWLILEDHPIWAIFTFIGALASGFAWRENEGCNDRTID